MGVDLGKPPGDVGGATTGAGAQLTWGIWKTDEIGDARRDLGTSTGSEDAAGAVPVRSVCELGPGC